MPKRSNAEEINYYADKIIDNMLKASGEPPPKLQPKFKVGDVVENKEGVRGMIDTTEKAEALIQADSYFSHTWAERFGRDYFFGVEWFTGERDGGFVSQDELTLCKGIKDSSLCDKCGYRFKCWTTRRK